MSVLSQRIKNYFNYFSTESVLASLAVSLIVLLSPLKHVIVPHFVGIHTGLEMICIGVSVMTFVVLFILRKFSDSNLFQLFGVPFLGIGILDLLHTFSYKGLPDIITPNTPEKSISFWLAARTLEAITFSVFILGKRLNRDLRIKNSLISTVVFLYVAVAAWLVFYRFDLIPEFIDVNNHITPLKIGYEFFLILIHLYFAIYLIHYQMRNKLDSRLHSLTTASLIFVVSGLSFSTFLDVHDTVIFAGHIFKVMAYYYIFKASLETELIRPYFHLIKLNNELLQQTDNIRRLQIQLAKLEPLSTVGMSVGSIVHDLNNMLTVAEYSAQSILQLTSGNENAENIRNYSEKIINSLGKTHNFQKLLLRYAKNVKNNEPVIEVGMVCTINEFMPLLKVLAGNQKTIEFKSQGSCRVFACSIDLEQVLLNLVVNARDAIGSKPGTIEISVGPESIINSTQTFFGSMPIGEYIKLRVIDDGIGISSDVLPNIFEPLFSTKEAEKGTGLGLTTVAEICKKYGAYIDVKSELSKGTEVSIYIPVMNS